MPTHHRACDDDRHAVTTTAGERFSAADHAALAALVYRRFGRDPEAAAAAWRRLLGNSCTVAQFMRLAAV